MSSAEFKCVFCKESFNDKETLQIHFRKHGDKNFHLNKGRSQDDLPSLTDKPANKDQAEMVECDVCPEVFTSISKAITHKHKVHPDHDAKYFCPWCGKLFTMKHLYNKHINTSHLQDKRTDNSFHCDVCNVDFMVPVAVLYHNKFFHRVFEMSTIGNSKKLKMMGKEAVQIFYCPFCGEEYDNKVNLNKHMGDDHNDENQHPDDVLRCPVCDAIFFHLDAYEVHLTYHSIDDMYSERSQIMDEITDFSLETVPPIAERVENLEPQCDEAAMGIEQLFEQTMADTKHKKKKHKKHKKSKSAITLDQFLTMNTDVFGEGLDFQGVEEVPSQTIAKRLKKPIKKRAQSKLPPDIEKLQRQGIVIKKKTSTPTVKHLVVKTNKIAGKTPHLVSQTKPLATTNDVLTKLINQSNSQIKIVKKSSLKVQSTNDETDETQQHSPAVDNNEPVENAEPNEIQSTISKENDMDTEESKETDEQVINEDAYPNNTSRKSPDLQNKILKRLDTIDDEESNHSQSILDEVKEETITTQTEKVTNVTDKLTALLNNTNIVIKSSNQQSVPKIIKNKETVPLNDEDKNMLNNEEDADPNINGDSNKNDSLNALKHLSHLIVKSSSQDKIMTSKVITKSQESDKKVDQSELNKIAHLIRNSPAKLGTNNSGAVVPQPTYTQCKAKVIESKESNFDMEDEIEEPSDKTVTDPIQPNQPNKLASILNNPHLNIQAIKKSPKVVRQKDSPTESLPKSEKSSVDLLKHLKNVTAKPVGVNKTLSMSTSSPKPSPQIVNTVKLESISPPIKHNKVIQENIEIFNIDDSDSDEANSNTAQINKSDNKETLSQNKPVDVIKNINKNITIKSATNTSKKVIDKVKEEFDSDCDDNDINDQNHHSPLPNSTRNAKLNPSQQINEKQTALNNVLKNLSKNITVKSGTASPSSNHFTITQDQNSRDSNFEQEGADSDADSLSDRVKITEMENASDEDVNDDHADMNDNTLQDNVKVQHPDDSNSDNDEGIIDRELNVNFSDEDIEKHTPNIVKTNPKLESLKNACKDLVIRPSGQTVNNTSQPPSSSDEIPPFAKSLSNQILIKNKKQGDNCNKQIKPNNSNSRNAESNVGRSMNKSAINQNMALSSHQVNTVNKEVKTVKTFQTQTQTQTVIQEITTTVTKTIKTVNQSTKQETVNTGQSISTPKKIQQINANNKNFQGIKVRQTTPMAGPRIRNPGMRPTRPVIPAPVRASNQLVPVRPRFNAPRQMAPRLPIVRPSTSGQPRPQVGTQVKVASGVFPTTAKRQNNTPGHFSCFKKPKESLFPETDFPPIKKQEGDSTVQFSSAMQMSKSNFASTTKTVKGNNVVTSTQMKSEMSASSQQLCKLRNLSGLSIMKSSQANQSHVEEKCESNAAKQNTLDAIQRLQSQGLLVKKPRVASESEHSNPGSDDMEHFSDGS